MRENNILVVSLLNSSRDDPGLWLTPRRRISQGRPNLHGKAPIHLLRDMDQPFVFEIRSRKGQYRFEFYDTSSPESWRLLRPDLVVLCYDISHRLTLINLQRVVGGPHPVVFRNPSFLFNQ